MFRASGSGVFARDPDAQLDMIQLETDSAFMNSYADKLTDTAWRLECSLREFANFQPRNFWFRYPIHVVDKTGTLDKLYSEGDPKNNLKASGKRKQTPESRKEEFNNAFDVLAEDGSCFVKSMAEYLDVSERTVRDRIREFKDDYKYKENRVYRCTNNVAQN